MDNLHSTVLAARGCVKRNWLERQLGPRAYELHLAVKNTFDPKNLFNPGKQA